MSSYDPATETGERRPVDQAAFRNVVGHFASGVTVITTQVDGKKFGTTASAVSSLSVEPPMMLACLNRSSSTHDAVLAAGVYGINILSEAQGDLAYHFGRKGADKFAGIAHEVDEHGVPLIDGALATLVCVVAETATGGTHTVLLGDVVAASASEGGPLTYYRGTLGRFERAQEREAYEATRDHVLRRRVPLGSPIDVDGLAADLGVAANLVHHALVALEAEALVSRDGSGAFTPTPVTGGLIDNLYDGRAVIETGVIETSLASASDAAVAAVTAIGDRLAATDRVTEDELAEFLDLHRRFHEQLVGLAGSKQLTESYRRLHIGAVLREVFDERAWSLYLDNAVIPELTDAVRRRDQHAAKTAVLAFTDYFKAAAKHVIALHGGAI